MAMLSIGDMAQFYSSRRANTRMTTELKSLGTELTTGIKSDLRAAVAGDSGPLSSLERSLTRLQGFKTATSEARLYSQTTQDVLGRVAGQLQAMVPVLAPIYSGTNLSAIDAASSRVAAAFDASVATLNTAVGGRHVMSGVTSGSPALASAEVIMDALKASVAGLTDADDISVAVDEWFAPTGGFDSAGYTGGAARAAVRISPEDDVRIDATANEPAIRTALAALAKGALAVEGVTSLDADGRAKLLQKTLTDTANGETELVLLRARVGSAQERIELASARNESEKASLETTRLALIAADPYETATRMELVQAQLESLYTITARMSRLSLTNYI